MVDYYNHWLWTPLCEAILALSYRADADEHHPLTVVKAKRGDGSSGAPGESGSPAGVAPGASGASAAVALAPELVSCLPLAAASGDWEGFGPAIKRLPEPLPRISKQQDLGWRRRELKLTACFSSPTWSNTRSPAVLPGAARRPAVLRQIQARQNPE